MRNVLSVLSLLAAAPAMAALVATTLIDGRQVECMTLKHSSAPHTVVFENGTRVTPDQLA